MRYFTLNIVIAVGIASIIFLLYRRQLPIRRFVYVLAILLVLTAIFDSLIVRNSIVAYNLNHTLGIYIGSAPIEDFFYAIVAALVGPLLWDYYEHKK